MLGKLRESIERRLMEKGVSLIMSFNRKGVILWHNGRKIRGNSVENGKGFSRTACIKALEGNTIVECKGDIVKLSGDSLSETAVRINLRSILVLPIDEKNFFYVDSVEKEFSGEDIVSIKESCYYLKECIRESERYYREKLWEIKTIDEATKKKILKYGAEAKTPVLLTGETGVGKGYLAKIIHDVSRRAGKYVNINSASLPEQLFESELFGYKKGAFTDAKNDKVGLIEEAEGGTLFLDEIGDMGFDSQTKILKVIEEGKYMRLGDSKERECDVRFVFSTNRDLLKLVKEKKFRRDLYYRISEFWIDVPPLRKRKDIIDDLIEEYENLLNGKKFSKEAMEFIRSYNWRGNIREFKSMLKRVGVMAEGKVIKLEDVVESIENHLNRGEIRELIERMGFMDLCRAKYEELRKIETEIENSKEKDQTNNSKIKAIIEGIEEGGSFWEVAWKRFIERDIDRECMKFVISYYYRKAGESYKRMLKKLNIKEEDYHKFMSLLHKYKIV